MRLRGAGSTADLFSQFEFARPKRYRCTSTPRLGPQTRAGSGKTEAAFQVTP